MFVNFRELPNKQTQSTAIKLAFSNPKYLESTPSCQAFKKNDSNGMEIPFPRKPLVSIIHGIVLVVRSSDGR